MDLNNFLPLQNSSQPYLPHVAYSFNTFVLPLCVGPINIETVGKIIMENRAEHKEIIVDQYIIIA